MNDAFCTMSKKKSAADGIPMSIVHFGEDGIVTHRESYNLDNVHLDRYGAEAIARSILPDILVAVEDPGFQADFEKWQAERQKDGANTRKKNSHRR